MTTPNMNLTLPLVSQTPGPTWASQINADLTIIDAHDHIAIGVPITTGAINIDADLSFNTHAATDLTKAVFLDGYGGTPNSVHTASGNLYFVNGSGQSVQITTGNTVNVGGTGNIGGIVGNAGISYVSGPNNFQFFDEFGNTAAIDVLGITTGTVQIKTVTLDGAIGASTYTLKLPTALPVSSTSFVTCTTSGQLAYVSQSGGITRPMLASVGQQVSTYVNNSLSAPGNVLLPVTITTTGRPLFVGFSTKPADAQSGYISINDTSGANFVNASFAVNITSSSPPVGFVAGNYLRNKVAGYVNATGSPLEVPVSSINGLVVVPAGTYTIQGVLVSLSGTGTPVVTVSGSIFAYEL